MASSSEVQDATEEEKMRLNDEQCQPTEPEPEPTPTTSKPVKVNGKPREILYPASQNSEALFSGKDDAKMDSVVVHNEKVRYYYNKTLYLRSSIDNMLEMLEKLHTTTFAYLAQLPETGDYSVIGTLFEMIPTISTMIDWRALNHSCYWEDFCRETKQLMVLLETVNGAALKCSDTATYNLAQAQQLFKGLVHIDRNILRIDRALTYRERSDYVSEDAGAQSIQIEWRKPGDIIILSWHDPDGGLLNVSLNDTGIGFRLRFLRHIIYHARSCLETALMTFMKVNIILHLHIPIEKLERCRDVELQTLSLKEKTYLIKAKREFDSSLDKIWKIVSRFKYQAFHLLKYKKTFRGMQKSKKYCPKTIPTFVTLKMSFDDSLLMRVMSMGIQAQAKEESFDFTVYPDRTEDIISIVEDLMATGNSGFRELQLLLAIVKGVLPTEKYKFSVKERQSTGDEVRMIMAHRFHIRKSLKKALEILEGHEAFQKIDKFRLLGSEVDSSREGSGDTGNPPATNSPVNNATEEKSLDLNNNESKDVSPWITLEGGIKVTMNAFQGIITQCPFTQTTKLYKDLSNDERIILAIRLIRQLLILAANEQTWAKMCCERVIETKSLMKRLKQKDRINSSLQSVILEQYKQIRQMLHLTKSMRFMRKFE